jgi:hypothetical protein
MIVAIEGASATGKTTWCRSHFADSCVPEAPENVEAPGLFGDPAEVGWFWVSHATGNWQKALAIEQERGIAVCDGDPFHLYFAWALWKTGFLPRKLFDIESALYRIAFEEQQIGFVDHVLWIEVPAEELHRRAEVDLTRRRKRHKMYLAIAPWMKTWFAERQRLLPATVHNLTDGLRIEELASSPSAYRYDLALMDKLVWRTAEMQPWGIRPSQ